MNSYKSEVKLKKENLIYPGEVAKEIRESLINIIKPGITTFFINDFIEKNIIKNGCSPGLKGYRGYPYSSCISVNEEICHGLPSNRILREGDTVNVDFVVEKNGWYSDTSRTFIVGNKKDYENLIFASELCTMEAIKLCGPDVKIYEIAKKINEICSNFTFYICKDFCGHGIDRYKLHSEPKIIYNLENKHLLDLKLKEGDVITMEPIICEKPCKPVPGENKWVYISNNGSRSAIYERTLIITENGFELLN